MSKQYFCVFKCVLVAVLFLFVSPGLAASTISNQPTHSVKVLPSVQRDTLRNRLTLSGDVNVAAYASGHTPTTVGIVTSGMGDSDAASTLSLSSANLMVEAKVLRWVQADVKFSYYQRAPSFVRSPSGGGDSFFVNKASVTFSDKNKTPLYAKVGRRVIDFGGHNKASFLKSLTRFLSSTRATMVGVGVEDLQGVSGSVYLFRGLKKITQTDTRALSEYGATVGYVYSNADVKLGAGVDYVSNIASASYAKSTQGNLAEGLGFTKRVAGLDLYGKMKIKGLDIGMNYLGALNSFSVVDVPFTSDSGMTKEGAKPVAWHVNMGLTFPLLGYQSRVGLGYMGSRESVALGTARGAAIGNTVSGVYGDVYAIGLPKRRYYGNYAVHLNEVVTFALECAYDRGYSHKNGGSAKAALIGLLALEVKFGPRA